jgi:hypothetical protein
MRIFGTTLEDIDNIPKKIKVILKSANLILKLVFFDCDKILFFVKIFLMKFLFSELNLF